MNIFHSLVEDYKFIPESSILKIFANRGLHAMFIYRVSNLFFKYKIPVIPLMLTRIIQILYSIDISYKASIGPGILIVHGVGLVIGNGVVIQGKLKIYHGVTIGILDDGSSSDGFPTIGENVKIGTGACLLGKISVGDNCVIAANSVVLRDLPAGSLAAGIPAQIKRLSA